MELLQVREKEIFEALRAIQNCNFVLIGGYAVNSYTLLPRFSIDCDIVVLNHKEASKISKILENNNYNLSKDIKKEHLSKFLKFNKIVLKSFKTSIDILIEDVLDRSTKSVCNAYWVFENSNKRQLKGKTITESLNLNIVNADALIVMKFVSFRNTDIRDIFMLSTQAKDNIFIVNEISKRCNFNDRFKKIKEKITSKNFRDNLQGVYGYIDDSIFEKHKGAVLELIKRKK